jgi:hypothetical protein
LARDVPDLKDFSESGYKYRLLRGQRPKSETKMTNAPHHYVFKIPTRIRPSAWTSLASGFAFVAVMFVQLAGCTPPAIENAKTDGGQASGGAGAATTSGSGGGTAGAAANAGSAGGAVGAGGTVGSGGAMNMATGGSGAGGTAGNLAGAGGSFASGGGAMAGISGTAGTGSAGRAAGTGGGAAGISGGTGGGGGGRGGLAGTTGLGGTGDPNKRHLLLRDEARSVVSYVELGNPAAGWRVTTTYGRDMQLVGGGRFMIGTDNGYEERSLANGAMVAQQNTFVGTLSAHRLRNGNTILAGANWQGGTGIVLVEVNASGVVQRKITYPGFSYVRLIRQTPTGTFLVTADDVVFEGDATGKIVWRANVVGPVASHVWQALRIPSGETVVSAGYAASIEIFGTDGTLHKTITGPASVVPNQFVGFQILANGNFVVANWQGHTGEKMGVQLLEYNPQGTLVWSYRPDTTTESLSLHHVIVLDGLDTTKLHVDDTTGVLVPVP